MIIHVVQPGDSLQSISEYYGVTIDRIILENGLEDPDHLVTGQTIIITFPEKTYIVKEGDTLVSIANSFEVPVLQLIINNPYLADREYIYPGEEIVITYTTKGRMSIHGNAVPYINQTTLRRTLPYLTYLSVLNYTATKEGEIISYYDDSELVQIAKEYGVMPLMLLTTLTIEGRANIRIAYDLLLNQDFQNTQIENILTILKEKGYLGINISLEYISVSNLYLYEDYFTKITARLNEEGYLVFVTINPELIYYGDKVSFERVNYSFLDQLAHNIVFMDYQWAVNLNPPSPISSIYIIDAFINYIRGFIHPDKINIGMATIGYDWELPFSAGLSTVNSVTLDRAVGLALNVGATIQFDEISQTPYFSYRASDTLAEHIVWFIDARSMNALLELVSMYSLHGIGVGNLNVYNTQLWLILYSQYEIEKVDFL